MTRDIFDLSEFTSVDSSPSSKSTPENKINPMVEMAAEQFARLLWELVLFRNKLPDSKNRFKETKQLRPSD